MVEYRYPTNIQEVVELLNRSTLLYAGGTGLYKRNLNNYKYILDLSRLDFKNILSNDKCLVFDALVTVENILDSPLVPEVLKEISREIASSPLRNLITVGGELFQCPYWANLPVYFFTVDAKVEYFNEQGNPFHIGCRKFYADYPTHNNVFIPRLQISLKWLDYKGVFYNFKETSFDYSVFNYLILQNRKEKKDTLITLGGIKRFPISFTMLEEQIKENGSISRKDIETACNALSANMRNDIRFSANYRSEVLKNQLSEDLEILGLLK